MSDIDSIKYAERYKTINKDGEVNNGVIFQDIYYQRPDESYWDFTDVSKKKIVLYENPRISSLTKPTILELQTFNNGLRYIMEYYTEDRGIGGQTGSTGGYYIDATFKIVDENDNVIDNIYLEDGHTIVVDSNYNTFFVVPHLIGSGLSDMEGLYVPSVTNYIDDNALTTSSSPDTILPFGEIFFQTGLFHDISELNGKTDRLLDNFRQIPTSFTSLISTQEELDAIIDGLKEAGDGKDPFDTDDDGKPPYEKDTSGTGGGGGNYERGGDDIFKPNLPIGQAIHTGFIDMYNPSLSDLRALSSKLWTDAFFENILKLWNDPMEGIISLALFPVAPSTSSAQNCVIGNYNTEVPIPVVSSQYTSVNCGNLSVNEYWGSALDYEPYTKISIFLPFIGIVPLHTDDVMNKNISVFYNIDFLTGSAVCTIMCGLTTLYEFPCNISCNIPITGSNYSELYGNIINSIKNVAIGGALTGNVGGAVAGGLTSATNVVTSKHSQVERGSNVTSMNGLLGHFKPFLIIHRPKQSLPSNFGHYKGFPSNITRLLSGVSGYTEIEYIHLDGLTGATDVEKDEIERLLQSGVVF